MCVLLVVDISINVKMFEFCFFAFKENGGGSFCVNCLNNSRVAALELADVSFSQLYIFTDLVEDIF